MAGLPHYRNSKAAMNRYEPIYNAQFEIQLTPPPSVSPWSLVMEQVLKVDGIETNKQPGVIEQKYKSAKRKVDIRQGRGICKIMLNHKPLKIFNTTLLKIDQNLIARLEK
jgi:hypothetical protein